MNDITFKDESEVPKDSKVTLTFPDIVMPSIKTHFTYVPIQFTFKELIEKNWDEFYKNHGHLIEKAITMFLHRHGYGPEQIRETMLAEIRQAFESSTGTNEKRDNPSLP